MACLVIQICACRDLASQLIDNEAVGVSTDEFVAEVTEVGFGIRIIGHKCCDRASRFRVLGNGIRRVA